jgi:hypothetical protein
VLYFLHNIQVLFSLRLVTRHVVSGRAGE